MPLWVHMRRFHGSMWRLRNVSLIINYRKTPIYLQYYYLLHVASTWRYRDVTERLEICGTVIIYWYIDWSLLQILPEEWNVTCTYELFGMEQCVWDKFYNCILLILTINGITCTVFQAFPQLFSVFFTFFVTLTIFPAIQSDIKPLSPAFQSMGRIWY